MATQSFNPIACKMWIAKCGWPNVVSNPIEPNKADSKHDQLDRRCGKQNPEYKMEVVSRAWCVQAIALFKSFESEFLRPQLQVHSHSKDLRQSQSQTRHFTEILQ